MCHNGKNIMIHTKKYGKQPYHIQFGSGFQVCLLYTWCRLGMIIVKNVTLFEKGNADQIFLSKVYHMDRWMSQICIICFCKQWQLSRDSFPFFETIFINRPVAMWRIQEEFKLCQFRQRYSNSRQPLTWIQPGSKIDYMCNCVIDYEDSKLWVGLTIRLNAVIFFWIVCWIEKILFLQPFQSFFGRRKFSG